MHSTPVSHGQAEALEQLAHRLGVADRGLHDARRQVLQAGQGQRPGLDLAERLPLSSISKLTLRRRS
jgi:hypothetical protein